MTSISINTRSALLGSWCELSGSDFITIHEQSRDMVVAGVLTILIGLYVIYAAEAISDRGAMKGNVEPPDKRIDILFVRLVGVFIFGYGGFLILQDLKLV